MKGYTVRRELRIPVHCQLYCFFDDGLISGIVRELSATGWRVTVDRPVPLNLDTHVFIAVDDAHSGHPLFIDSGIVRWTDGREAGWEITRIDESICTRLINFMEQVEQVDVASRVPEEAHPVVVAAPA